MALGPLAPWLDRGFRDDAGNVLSGGLVYSYLAGTSTPTDTYTSSDLVTPNANPVVLDSAGRATIYLDPDITYKFIVQDSGGSTLYTLDDVPGQIPLQTPITIDDDGIGSTSTDGLVLTNATVAANNAQQWSPRARWTGAGWNATASASRVLDGIAELQPLQNASGDPSARLVFSSQVNAGGYTPRLSVGSNGVLAGATTPLGWGSSGIGSPDIGFTRAAAGQLTFDDLVSGGSHGVVLDVNTNNQLLVLSHAGATTSIVRAGSLVCQKDNPIDALQVNADVTTNAAAAVFKNGTAFRFFVGRDNSAGNAIGNVSLPYAGSLWMESNHALQFGTNNTAALTLDTSQNAKLYGSLAFNSTSSTISWTAQSLITNTANGAIKLTQASGTVGILLKFTSDQVLSLRDRGDSAFAALFSGDITSDGNVDAQTFSANGSSGIDFGPAAPASITVVKGLIVAAS